MKPNTICHPEALDDWRANDERPSQQRITSNENGNNKVQKKHSTKLEGILALRLKEAIERENRKRGTVRKKR